LISTDLGVNNQPSNEAGIQTNQTMPDSNDNSMSESGSLVGAEPARPTDPNKETGKQTVESTLLQDNRLDDEIQEVYALTAMFDEGVTEYQNEDPLIIYKATSDPSTMYHHETMREKDADQFREAMAKEWNDQVASGNYTKVLRSELPQGATVLPSVW